MLAVCVHTNRLAPCRWKGGRQLADTPSCFRCQLWLKQVVRYLSRRGRRGHHSGASACPPAAPVTLPPPLPPDAKGATAAREYHLPPENPVTGAPGGMVRRASSFSPWAG